jgi:hypothetical protein
MSNPPYEFSRESLHRYTFTSSGKRAIDKVVEFTPMSKSDVYNLAFGDLLPNGEKMTRLIQTTGILLRSLQRSLIFYKILPNKIRLI